MFYIVNLVNQAPFNNGAFHLKIRSFFVNIEDMKINYKNIGIIFIFFVIACLIFFRIEYNKPENVLSRAKKYCIDNNHEYRSILNSDGAESEICIVDGKKIDSIEYYNNRNK
ncbi:hypothetical protein KBH77_02395 [Patescibacteria group bacterium]|nr:hypothetical protein [Patescibacteria group bacterium]HQL11467.1 hypothetical protein [bacterium]